MRKITVGELKELIKDMDEGDLVVTPVSDHEYMGASVNRGTAIFFEDGRIDEDHGEETGPNGESGKRQPVLIVG